MTYGLNKMNAITNAINAVLGRGIYFLLDGENKICPLVSLVGDHIPDASRDELKFALQNFLAIEKNWPGKGDDSQPSKMPEFPPIKNHFESSVGEVICRLLLENPPFRNGKIAAVVCDAIPHAKTTAAAVACYRTALVSSGKLQSSGPLPPVGSLICKLLMENWSRSNDDIAAEIRRRLNSRTSANNIANYRNYLRCAASVTKTERMKDGNPDKPENGGRKVTVGIATVEYEKEFFDYLLRVRRNRESGATNRRSNLRRVSKTLSVIVTPKWIRSVDIEKIADELKKKGVPSREPGQKSSSSPLDDCKTAMRRYREMCEEQNLR